MDGRRLLRAGFVGQRLRATDGGVGVELCDVDLRSVDPAPFAALYCAWLEHGVLLVRGQSLTDNDLITFSRRFGELDVAPVQETGRRFVRGLPELYIVSNVIENGEPIGSLGHGEAVWHTDMSYAEVPPKASILYALEVPPVGGDTSFVDMAAVYAALPKRLILLLAGVGATTFAAAFDMVSRSRQGRLLPDPDAPTALSRQALRDGQWPAAGLLDTEISSFRLPQLRVRSRWG